MSAAPGSSLLRARIAQALGTVLAEHSQADLGGRLGIAGSTVCRRADDLSAWPATDLLALAAQDQALAEAVVAYLRGEQGPQGQAVRAIADLVGALAWVGRWTQSTAAALADGRITRAEAAALRAQLRELRPLLGQLDGDLAMIEDRS